MPLRSPTQAVQLQQLMQAFMLCLEDPDNDDMKQPEVLSHWINSYAKLQLNWMLAEELRCSGIGARA